jgi:hypothetical protein
VTARVTRLWFVEYDYQGPALAQGSFELHPGRFLELEPTTLRFQGGSLAVGEHRVANRVEGTLDARIAATALESVTGLAIFEPITARFDVRLEGGDLAFTDVYLGPRIPAEVSGAFAGSIGIGLERGKLTADSRVELHAPEARVTLERATVLGDLDFRMDVDSKASPPRVRLRAKSEHASASDGGPSLRNAGAGLEFASTTVFAPFVRESSNVGIASIECTDLGWFERFGEASEAELTGRARGSLDYVDDSARGRSGELALEFDELQISQAKRRLEVTGNIKAGFVSEPKTWVALKNIEGRLSHAALEMDGERWDRWSLDLRSNSFRVLEEPLALQSTADFSVTNSGGLVKLALPDLPAKIAAQVFQLRELKGRIAWYSGDGLLRAELMQAASGDVSAEGAWMSNRSSTKGALLVRTPITDFGVALDRGDTEVTLDPANGYFTALGLR